MRLVYGRRSLNTGRLGCAILPQLDCLLKAPGLPPSTEVVLCLDSKHITVSGLILAGEHRHILVYIQVISFFLFFPLLKGGRLPI